MKTVTEMAREAGLSPVDFPKTDSLKRFAALVRADERERFYGQDKPAECVNGCPANKVCDYCQIVDPVKALITAEREACVKECKKLFKVFLSSEYATGQPLSSFKERHAVAACIESIEARGQA